MKSTLFATTAALALLAGPAQAVLVNDASQLNGGAGTTLAVIDFEAYDGLLTSGPEALAPGLVFTGDAGSELGAYARDLNDNGLWGVGNHFAASGFVGELRFTFDNLVQGAGAFVNHFAAAGLPFALVVTAYGANHQIIETHTLSLATGWDSYNAGSFAGIQRATADMRALSFKGVGVVVDDFSYTAAVPEPQSLAMMLAGLGFMGFIALRRQRD